MTSPREAFLQRVRQAVQAGNRAGAPGLEPRGNTGYQGAGPDPVARFEAECLVNGAQVHVVPDGESAASRVTELLRTRSVRNALVGRGEYLDPLYLPDRLRKQGVEAVPVDGLAPGSREVLFAAEAGVGGVDYLIAETGSVVVRSRPEEPRSLSLLPPLHIAVAHRRQLLPDLFDLFAVLAPHEMPSCLTLISGPSKTGDIELRLVTGVHGPGEIHVVMIRE